MARLKLTVAYIGTHLHGWQVQASPPPTGRAHTLHTVQGELERIVARIVGHEVRLHGSGRTDAGVHADAQIAHMDIPDSKLGVNWLMALNARLPESISVLAVEHVDDDFHARYSAIRKTYTYRLWLSRGLLPPRVRPFVWATGPLDTAAMEAAAQHLVGTHDFSSFQNAGTDIATTVRTLHSITPREGTAAMDGAGDVPVPAFGLAYRFEANGFLKQMVRNLMGLLVTVGRGKIKPDEVPSILAACNRAKAPVTAPASGLTLTAVHYPPHTARPVP